MEKYILQLCEAIQLPKEITVIHCRGHQRGTNEIAIGNKFANHTARTTPIKKSPVSGVLTPLINLNRLLPQCTKEEIYWADQHRHIKDEKGWSQESLIYLPQNIQWKVIKGLHNNFHLGRDKLIQFCSHLFTSISKGYQKLSVR